MGHFWLEFDSQGHRQRYDFQQASVSIGREETSDFHLDHPTVSRQHAMIVENYGNYQLVVLSRNGLTAVDGQVVSGTIDLRPGMTIQVGEVQLGFRAAIGNGSVGEVATEALSLAAVNAHAPTGAMRPVEERTEPSRDAWDGPGWAAANAPQQQQFQQQQPAGFGQMSIQPPQQPQQQPYGTTGGFGQMPINPPPANGVAGGFNGVPAPAKPSVKSGGDDDFKIKSWEEIAAEASTGAHDAIGGPTDFERIQRAQAKAQKKGGTNPALIGVLVVALGGMAALFLYDPKTGPKIGTGTDAPARCDGLKICYPIDAEPTCKGPADCEAKAIQAYNVADELTKKKDANITNRYEAYKQLDKAARYMALGNFDKAPDAMKDFDARLLSYEEELDNIAKEHRIRNHQLAQRNMGWEMAENVRSWQAYFPDSFNVWFREAIEEERRMRDGGTWPEKFDPKVRKKKR